MIRPKDLVISTMMCKRCAACFRRPYTVCPIYEEFGRIPPFSPPSIIFLGSTILFKQMKASSELAVIPYACTLCGSCSANCGQFLLHLRWETPARLFEGIRSLFIEEGAVPAKISEVLNNLAKFGNAWGLSLSSRTAWEKDLNIEVPEYTSEKEYLLFVGDAAFIDEAKPAIRSLVSLLSAAGMSFGTLKEREVDSGDMARELGEYGLFEELARKNIETFTKHRVKKIITVSPHDYNTFVIDYLRLGFKAEVYHYAQLLDQLISGKKLRPVKSVTETITYHDPCFLGRYHGIFDSPRRIIKAIPGANLVEMERKGRYAFCCGGGGGRMWYDPQEPTRTRISNIRVNQARNVGAKVIVTACPYCKSMLLASDNLGEINIKDLAEILAASCL